PRTGFKRKAGEAFLKNAIDSYLLSPEHIDKMAYRLEELFHLRPSSTSFDPLLEFDPNGSSYSPASSYSHYNSLNHLFREIALRNLPWDRLLISKVYKAFPLSRFERRASFGLIDD